MGVSLSPDGTYLLIADTYNNAIRKLYVSNSAVSTIAGSGPGGYAEGSGAGILFYNPASVAISSDGSFALVVESTGNRVRRLNLLASPVTSSLVAGDPTLAYSNYGYADGCGASAKFFYPNHVSISSDNYWAFVADQSNHKVRYISLYNGCVGTLVSITGPVAAVPSPFRDYVLISASGHKIYKVSFPMGSISDYNAGLTVLAGSGTGATVDGIGTSASFLYPDTFDITGCRLAGYGAMSAGLQCVQCSPGTFGIGNGVCQPCPAGDYNPSYGVTVCPSCTGNTFSGPNATVCTACPASTTTSGDFSKCLANAG